MELEHKEITEQIIGASFEVFRELGYGFLERVYQQAMKVELELRGLKLNSRLILKCDTKIRWLEIIGLTS